MTVIQEPARVYCMGCGHLVAMHADLEGHCQLTHRAFHPDHGWTDQRCSCTKVKELVEEYE